MIESNWNYWHLQTQHGKSGTFHLLNFSIFNSVAHGIEIAYNFFYNKRPSIMCHQSICSICEKYISLFRSSSSFCCLRHHDTSIVHKWILIWFANSFSLIFINKIYCGWNFISYFGTTKTFLMGPKIFSYCFSRLLISLLLFFLLFQLHSIYSQNILTHFYCKKSHVFIFIFLYWMK